MIYNINKVSYSAFYRLTIVHFASKVEYRTDTESQAKGLISFVHQKGMGNSLDYIFTGRSRVLRPVSDGRVLLVSRSLQSHGGR